MYGVQQTWPDHVTVIRSFQHVELFQDVSTGFAYGLTITHISEVCDLYFNGKEAIVADYL
jgi:hypothetical protein